MARILEGIQTGGYTDGAMYPSASMAGVPELRCGDLAKQSLERI